MIKDEQLLNYSGGEWRRSHASEFLDVRNPATAETLVRAPLTPPEEVDEAARAAQAAFAEWRRTPPTERIQYLFKLKRLLDEHFDEIARLTTQECGKTLVESQGELRRGIENEVLDRKSTRLNSSHTVISYAVFCLKKKKSG